MTIVYITLLFFVIGALMAIVGKLWLTYYGFKYNPGLGLAVLLLDPLALWFAFYKLEKEGKERWVTTWLAGLGIVLVTTCGFWAPLNDAFTGAAFQPGYAEAHASGPVNTILQGNQAGSVPPLAPTPSAPVEPPSTNNSAPEAPAQTNNSTDGAAATNNSTDNGAAPAATNNDTAQ